MPYKRPTFMLKHWLLFGGRWRSPYHRIAYELASPKRATTVRRLLEYGFISRAAELLKNTSLSTPSCEALLAFLSGKPDLAREVLLQALKSLPANHPEQRHIIKLLTRLAPECVISWAHQTNNNTLAVQLAAAIAPHGATQRFTFSCPRGDEHLLVANTTTTPQEKLQSLNSFFKEKGLLPTSLLDGDKPFDINNLRSSAQQLNSKRLPYVSVIMTAYNGQEFIRSAALSILHQTDVKVELIIIDDSSSDSTWQIIERLKSEYPHQIQTKKLPENMGTYKAKNVALTMCKGDFIAFQDADDWSHPQRLARSIAWIQKSSRRVATTCRYVRLDRNSRFYSPGVWPLNQWSPNTLVFRRSIVLEKLGGFDTVRTGADTEYFERIRLFFGDKSILFSKDVLLLAMSLSTSLMHTLSTGVDKNGYSIHRVNYREERAEEFLSVVKDKKILKIPI